VKEEIGDVTIYLTELADKLGIDTVEAAKAKVAPPPHDPNSGIRAKRLVHTPFFFT
jgi:hypothetical protein